jgi:hypothetical protein
MSNKMEKSLPRDGELGKLNFAIGKLRFYIVYRFTIYI